MPQQIDDDYRRLPGLFRLWDLQSVIDRRDEWQIHYAEMTGDGTPLFMVFRRPMPSVPVRGAGAVQ